MLCVDVLIPLPVGLVVIIMEMVLLTPLFAIRLIRLVYFFLSKVLVSSIHSKITRGENVQ